MANEADREAIGEAIDGMYRAISGPAGPRDWELNDRCFHGQSRQMRTGVDAEGKSWIKIMDQAQYRRDTEPFFAQNSFYERELKRRIDILGNMAHAWSLYEARTNLDDAEPERRGINSIQLYKGDDGQWRIISMIWDNERPGVAVDPF